MSERPAHPQLASGRWFKLTLAEQLGNIGSEVGRAIQAKTAANSDRSAAALERALELFDLTIADPRLAQRLKEIIRAREVVCDFLAGNNNYQSTPETLEA